MVKSSLLPDETLQKVLISTPSRFVGELNGGHFLLTHAWPDFADRHIGARLDEGPASRSAYVFVFRTEAPKKKQVALPNYSAAGPMICSYLAVIFGKRFDSHGLTEGTGFFHVPEPSAYLRLCDHRLPWNSHKPRSDLNIPLKLEEARVLEPLLGDTPAEDMQFVRTFQGASKFYLQALQNFDSDPEVAYLHLITCLEIISESFAFDKAELFDSDILDALDRVRSELDGGAALASIIEGRLYAVRRRVLRTVTRLITEEFYRGGEGKAEWAKIQPDSMQRRILAAYDLRSRYVHTGVPFGRWISLPRDEEIQPGKPVVDDPDYGKLLHRAPTFVGLERIVRFCLLRFLHTNGVRVRDELRDDV